MGSADVLLSPVVLFFVLGAMAAVARSDLAIPEAIAKGLSLYLMAAIGLKGGVEVAGAGFSIDMLLSALAGISLSLLLPLPAFFALRRLGRLGTLDAAATSAHYGSVSVVTFVTGVEVLTASGTSPAGYMVAVLALMETPAILVGLLLARSENAANNLASKSNLLHETLFNGSVVLLIGSFAIGLIAGKEGMAPIAPVFDTAFRGVLCLFLLDMGLIAGRRLVEVRALTWRTVGLGILLPVCNGFIGVAVGSALGLDIGSATAMGILAGSASYIAVPAAMRLAVPQADPGIFLGMSLAVTFPFNILIGIPFYLHLATRMAA